VPGEGIVVDAGKLDSDPSAGQTDPANAQELPLEGFLVLRSQPVSAAYHDDYRRRGLAACRRADEQILS